MKDIRKGSFVVVSDFHSFDWPLKKIKDHYLNEYETIYILGDATDRGEKGDGTGGVNLLLKIKELTEMYPGRVIYVPGNHDDFIFEYAKYRDLYAERLLNLNHGSKTIEDINILRQENPRKFMELIEWLGSLPLQREHFYKGQRYVLAHALFNEELFQESKEFSLEDYRRYNGYYGEYENLLWFRKDDGQYDAKTLPRNDSIMIIGHTPLCYREGEDLSLNNAYGEKVKIYCVDGGIAYDGTMQKYCGGVGVNDTFKWEHTCPTEEEEEKPKEVTPEKDKNNTYTENCVKDIIIRFIEEYKSLDTAIQELIKIVYGNENGYFMIDDNKNKIISKSDVKKYLDEIYLSYIPTNSSSIERPDYMEVFRLYFTKIALDYITKCQFERFETKQSVIRQMKSLMTTGEYGYITDSIGGARTLAEKIGIDRFAIWMRKSEYPTFNDYIEKEFGNQYEK